MYEQACQRFREGSSGKEAGAVLLKCGKCVRPRLGLAAGGLSGRS
eukprot:SAG11_NODE_24449_length_373_cov_0.733577_1_plen_44_part_01